MNEDALEHADEAGDLPAIEFDSPGRFDIHNPETGPASPAAAWEAAPFVLGEHDAPQRFASLEQARAHALALLEQARRTLCIYTPDLEPWLYHHSQIQAVCQRFLIAHPRNRLRILIGDVTRAVKEGNRLLTLARRLSSNCHIRKLNPDYPNEEAAYLLADTSGLLFRPEPEQYAGYALYNHPGRVRVRQAAFDQAWDSSLSDPDLRSFLL